jgi:Pyridoxamine 5'-phosphate oxidase
MSNTYPAIDDKIAAFIQAQKMFFVATAPLSDVGHVNLSPKGYDSFRILDPLTVAYADLGGSGIETVAHIRENGRITIMFCAFDGPANILRLYGRGRVMQFDHPDFKSELARFPAGHEKARNLIFVDLMRIMDSCGWAVPFYDFRGERDQLRRYIDHKDRDEWYASRVVKNARSLDGLPGIVSSSGESQFKS